MAKSVLQDEPSWPTSSTKRANAVASEFKNELRSIAQTLAKHERAESVLVRHVDEAFGALSMLGLRRRKLRERPEILTSVGVALIALAFALPDIVALFVDDENFHKAACLATVTPTGIGGIAFWVIGWLRGSSPPN